MRQMARACKHSHMSLFDTFDDQPGDRPAVLPGPGAPADSTGALPGAAGIRSMAGGSGAEARRVSLVRLSALIAQAVGGVGRVAVEGEVHKPQSGRTGRQWFSLRDRASQVSVSVPSTRRSRCRVVGGERVCVTGRLEWVNDWGQLQLSAEEVIPVGAGAIAAMIVEARQRLEADGLLARARRRIPRLPVTIGVVCGHEAAVRADIESVVTARFPGYPMLFAETTVSGPGAVDTIIAAMQDLDARSDIEVIILARGGGDATQLLPFSDEALCRALCATSTPVVAAIGHDGDRPLVDEVADLRCATPSLAAGAVVPDRLGLLGELDALRAQAAGSTSARLGAAHTVLAGADRDRAALTGLDRAAARLARAAAQRELVHPARELERAGRRLDRVDWRTPAASTLVAAGRAMTAAHAQAEALSPARVLDRGYAVVRRTADAAVVRHPDQVGPGTTLDIAVAGGHLVATTSQVADRPAATAPPRPAAVADRPAVPDRPGSVGRPGSVDHAEATRGPEHVTGAPEGDVTTWRGSAPGASPSVPHGGESRP